MASEVADSSFGESTAVQSLDAALESHKLRREIISEIGTGRGNNSKACS